MACEGQEGGWGAPYECSSGLQVSLFLSQYKNDNTQKRQSIMYINKH